MKRIVLLITLLLNVQPLFAARAQFRLSIVPESRRSNDSATISWGSTNSSNGSFFLVLANLTDKPEPVFERWNSWGYQTISFEMILPDGTKAFITTKAREFTRNILSTFVVPPHGYAVFPIEFNDDWEGKPKFADAGETKVKLRAIYKVDPSRQSKAKGVWTGQVKSEWLDVVIRHW